MLKFLRKKTKLVIWTVVIAFSLWGGFSIGVQSQKKGRYAGEVFGKSVSFQEFNRFYRIVQLFSNREDSNRSPEVLHQQAWENILLSMEAKKLKIQVSDEEVVKEIRRIFEAGGVADLSTDYYLQWLRNVVKFTPKEFEAQIREQLRIQKLVSKILSVPVDPPTHEEAIGYFLEASKKIKAQQLIFASLEEAEKFKTSYETSSDFDAALKQFPLVKMHSVDKMDRDAWVNKLQLDKQSVEKAFVTEAKHLSEPIKKENEYWIFHVTEIESSPATDLDDTKKKELTQKIVDERRNLEFLKWHLDLFQRSELKDFISEETP